MSESTPDAPAPLGLRDALQASPLVVGLALMGAFVLLLAAVRTQLAAAPVLGWVGLRWAVTPAPVPAA